jgi:hypothetical protein
MDPEVTVQEIEIRLTVYSNRTAGVYKDGVAIVTDQKVTFYEIDVVSTFHNKKKFCL